ncbi:unnamed protein product [Symbiodinium sp. CCMP2592]|nr:unnamed protein product [Symbiodinium sp. CCMP2592]
MLECFGCFGLQAGLRDLQTAAGSSGESRKWLLSTSAMEASMTRGSQLEGADASAKDAGGTASANNEDAA